MISDIAILRWMLSDVWGRTPSGIAYTQFYLHQSSAVYFLLPVYEQCSASITIMIPNLKLKKKFWDELIAHFLFTVLLESDTTSRKKTGVYVLNKVSKTTQFGGCIANEKD
jgi:hypothetical protein